MKFLINKPYLIFWFSIPLIILVGILSKPETLDLNIYDTYFVFTKYHLSILISILFGILGFGYWIMKKTDRKLIKWLNWIHIMLTIGGLIVMLGISYLLFGDKQSELTLYELNRQNLMLNLTILIIIFGQFFYLMNMIIGIFRKNKNSG